MTLLDDSVTQAFLASRITGSQKSYLTDNPVEAKAVIAYLKGGSKPTTFTTAMGKHLVYLEDARRNNAPPNPNLGVDVGFAPDPLSGTPKSIITTSDLFSAVSSAVAGSVIDGMGRTFDLGGSSLLLTHLAGVAELRNVTLVNGGTDSNVRAAGTASKWILRDVASNKSKADGFKFTDFSSGITLVDCSAADNIGQGFSTSQNAADWTHWNCRAEHNGFNGGSASSLDHGWYIGAALGDCRILNPYAHNNAGYGIQVQYAGVKKLLISCPEIDGGDADVRGGLVLSAGCSNVTVVAPYIHNAATEACHVNWGDTVYNCVVYDGYEENNGGSWTAGAGVTYTGCKTGSAGLIDPARYSLVSAIAANKVLRVSTPKAGCFA